MAVPDAESGKVFAPVQVMSLAELQRWCRGVDDDKFIPVFVRGCGQISAEARLPRLRQVASATGATGRAALAVR